MKINEKIQMRDKSKIYNEMDINSCSGSTIQGGNGSFPNANDECLGFGGKIVKSLERNNDNKSLIYKMIFSLCVFLVLILLNTGKAYAISGTVSVPSTTTSSTVQVKVTLNGTASNCAVAVWSQRNGQDDLKWYWNYSAASSYTFNINLANHDSVNNVFSVHVYADDVFIGGDDLIWIPSDLSISGNVPAYTRDGKITVTVTSNYTITKGCAFPTWSVKNYQDDLVWYADTTEKKNYSYTINLANHGSEGELYTCHIYAYDRTMFVTGRDGIIWDGTGPSISASNIICGSNLTATISDSVSGLSRIRAYHINFCTI